MGTAMVSGRADLRPVYRWIFARLQEESCRWIYSFPRLYLVSPLSPGEELTTYDPSEAIRREIERDERAERIRDLQDRFHELYRAAIRRARQEPLPKTVAAYRDVFGALLEGWPHPDM